MQLCEQDIFLSNERVDKATALKQVSEKLVDAGNTTSGYGLPFSLLLHTPALDQWRPGEDNGTFRGNTSAFITARATLETFWADNALSLHVFQLESIIKLWLAEIHLRFAPFIKATRGRGLFYGIEFYEPERAKAISRACFEQQMIIERAGDRDQVIKLMPALTISEAQLHQGLDILQDALEKTLSVNLPAEQQLVVGE